MFNIYDNIYPKEERKLIRRLRIITINRKNSNQKTEILFLIVVGWLEPESGVIYSVKISSTSTEAH